MPLPFRTVASNPSEVSTVGTIEEVLQTAAPTTGRLQTASIEGNLGHRLRSYDQSPSPGFAFSKPQQTPRSLAVKRTTLPFAEVRSVEPALPPFPIRLENKPVAIAGETHTANALPRRAIAGTYSALPPLPAAVAVKPEDHYCKLPSRTAPFKHIASPLAPSAAIAGFPSTAAAPGWGVGAMNGPRMGPRPSNSALQTTYGPHGLSPYKLVRSEARQCAKHRPTGCLPHTYKPESFAYPSKQGDFSVPYGHHNPIFRSDNVQGPRPTYRQGKMMRAYVDKTPGLTRRVSDDFGRDVNVTSHPPFDAVSRYSSQSSTELTNSSRVTADRNNLDRLRRKYPVGADRW
ncbi:MAG: hypothetical protein KVP17_001361 [Porospora cf. gigantea B]|uniref:uncharacterized protein n=1 Tax=Porospora cf. gigantea B TaxID=2853592 RepID=UPI003571EEAA|nr:MAG: hypothetical protein KVP17_001361 [Porospora cf. gigantea B]